MSSPPDPLDMGLLLDEITAGGQALTVDFTLDVHHDAHAFFDYLSGRVTVRGYKLHTLPLRDDVWLITAVPR